MTENLPIVVNVWEDEVNGQLEELIKNAKVLNEDDDSQEVGGATSRCEVFDIDELIGLTCFSIVVDGTDEIHFIGQNKAGEKKWIKMHHNQTCCENVYLVDETGDFMDIVGTEIIEAQVASKEVETNDGDIEWTFYKIRTIKGTVTLRWQGESNGYYGTSVDIESLSAEKMRKEMDRWANSEVREADTPNLIIYKSDLSPEENLKWLN